MKIDLINALRDAADWVEKYPEAYDWDSSSDCNCGIVATFLIGLVPSKKRTAKPFLGFGSWGKTTKDWGKRIYQQLECEATGTPIIEVINQLVDAGLDVTSMGELELLSNPTVRSRAGLVGREYNGSKIFAAYASAWADMLESESAAAVGEKAVTP